MKYININEFNKAIRSLEQSIVNSRFIKRTPNSYQKIADDIRKNADYLASLLESEIPAIEAK